MVHCVAVVRSLALWVCNACTAHTTCLILIPVSVVLAQYPDRIRIRLIGNGFRLWPLLLMIPLIRFRPVHCEGCHMTHVCLPGEQRGFYGVNIGSESIMRIVALLLLLLLHKSAFIRTGTMWCGGVDGEELYLINSHLSQIGEVCSL